MKIALIGCGFVADNYVKMLEAYAHIALVGVYDRDPDRLAAFSRFHRLAAYGSLAALLADDRVQMVVNLTNPSSHYDVSMAALLAGKHVYSEKPLAMTLAEAEELAAVARRSGLGLAAAPCNHLSDSTRTLLREVRSGRLGRVMFAQAEMDDGMVARLDYQRWRSRSGAPWPARDEFEVGCTMEHAGYQITPLVTLFGPVQRVTSFNACLMPEKGQDVGLTHRSPDLSIGTLEFVDGVVARLTCSILAPFNRSLRVIGSDGVATLTDVWEYHAPVRVSRTGAAFAPRLVRAMEKRLSRYVPGILLGRTVRPVAGARIAKTAGGHRMDFARGIAQLAAQVTDGGPPLVGPELALHVTEVTLALQDGATSGRTVTMRTALP